MAEDTETLTPPEQGHRATPRQEAPQHQEHQAHQERQEDQHLSTFCPRFHIAVEIIGRRWSGVILRAMLAGATRYTDIACSVPKLSDRLLSERLKEFEAEGIVTRTVIPETPVRIEYHLTKKGQSLERSFE